MSLQHTNNDIFLHTLDFKAHYTHFDPTIWTLRKFDFSMDFWEEFGKKNWKSFSNVFFDLERNCEEKIEFYPKMAIAIQYLR